MSNNFRQTDIGLIPEDWGFEMLGSHCSVFSGYGFKSSEFSKVGIHVIKIGDLQNGRVILTEDTSRISDDYLSNERMKKFILKEDDILIALTGATTGKVAILKGFNVPMLLNQRVGKVSIMDDLVDNVFVQYVIQTKYYQKRIQNNILQSAQGNVSPSNLEEIKIPLPPLPEQKKIAYVLSTIQQAIETQEQIIKTTQELKKALMQKLFTEGLPASGGTEPEPQKQTEIGPIPESWEVINLEDTGDVVYGIQASVAHLKKPIGLPILTNKNIAFDGRIDLSELNYFELKTKRHFNTILKKGDILFNWRSGSIEHVGKSAYFDLDGEYVHSSFILRIRPKEGINNKYLFYYLTHLRQSEYFIKLHSYSINAKFNKSAVNNLPTALPNPDKQELIANYLSTADQKIVKEEASLRSLQELFNSMLNNLMTGQIRVKDIEFEIEKTQLSLLEKGRRDVLEW